MHEGEEIMFFWESSLIVVVYNSSYFIEPLPAEARDLKQNLFPVSIASVKVDACK